MSVAVMTVVGLLWCALVMLILAGGWHSADPYRGKHRGR